MMHTTEMGFSVPSSVTSLNKSFRDNGLKIFVRYSSVFIDLNAVVVVVDS